MTTANLCDACSKQKGVTDEAGFGLAEAFLGSAAAPSAALAELVCPACGFTASQLKKIGRMGCPECYSTFREGLDELLRAMHKGLQHEGKRPQVWAQSQPPVPVAAPPVRKARRTAVPKAAAPKAEAAPTLEQLRRELEEAVREERFEEAARLKKLIDGFSAAETP
jgi:protein arginine kinase activator